MPPTPQEDHAFSRFSWRRFQRYGVTLPADDSETNELSLSHSPPPRCKSSHKFALPTHTQGEGQSPPRCAPLVRVDMYGERWVCWTSAHPPAYTAPHAVHLQVQAQAQPAVPVREARRGHDEAGEAGRGKLLGREGGGAEGMPEPFEGENATVGQRGKEHAVLAVRLF